MMRSILRIKQVVAFFLLKYGMKYPVKYCGKVMCEITAVRILYLCNDGVRCVYDVFGAAYLRDARVGKLRARFNKDQSSRESLYFISAILFLCTLCYVSVVPF